MTAANETTPGMTEHELDQFVGELYRDANGHEVWRIKNVDTGQVLRQGIKSDHDYRWLPDASNRGEDYADDRENARLCATG